MGVLYKKQVVFGPFFAEKGGGVWPNPKNPYQKKTEVVKKGGGRGGLSFLLKVKKTVFLPLP